ncbi:hypothetical protein [Gordonia sp. (in: high G+C Gram-positive bacteria)]|uniref:hypothetical protein n=1 Tax=Gordonia sp. (in: high G+C Gram-positive bacteria) TaxID=84139 RepID=UPI003C72275E
MIPRTLRRSLLTTAAVLAMLTGFIFASPGQAAAADRYQGPQLKAEQGSFGDKNLKLTLTNPNSTAGFFNESSCTSVLLSGTQALEAYIAYNAKDYIKLVAIMLKSESKAGPAASNNLLSPGPNSNSKNVKAADGVYIFLGTCGGIKSLEPGNVGVGMLPIVVPSGIGSIGSVLDFGSLALESGAGSSDVATLIGLLSGS